MVGVSPTIKVKPSFNKKPQHKRLSHFYFTVIA